MIKNVIYIDKSQTGTSKEVRNSIHNPGTDAIGHTGIIN